MIPADALNAILQSHGVSAKEQQVLSMALDGMLISDIAEQLEIMPDAARKRLGEVYRKFGIKGRGSGKLAKLQHILLSQYQPELSALKTTQDSKSADKIYERDPVDWGNSPDLPYFFGRESELQELEELLLDDPKALISLVGMKGIGKTAVALRFAAQSAAQFEGVFWRSLDSTTPLSIGDVMTSFVTYVRGKADGNDLLSEFMDCLRQSQFLVVLDGFEVWMTEGADQLVASDLLQRIGKERHQSCVVITSRENPREVVDLEECDHPVKTLMLEGLESKDAEQILEEKGLQSRSYWNDLIAVFQGNPLALQLISGRIQRFFGGDVGEFLKQETITLHQIDDLLAQQFHSLSLKEKEVLAWLSVKDEALSFRDLKQSLDWSGAVLLETLESLVRRSLVQGEMHFDIHPTLKKYILYFLRQEADIVKMPDNHDDIHALLERCLVMSTET